METNVKLFPSKLIAEMGREWYEENKYRGTGRTTSEALRVISEAMIAPNTDVDVLDRTGPDHIWYQSHHFPRVVKDTIEKLGLNNFRVNFASRTLTYKINL